MRMTWTLSGAWAEKFPSHCWRVPIPRRLDLQTIHQPMRVNPAEEFPNYGGKPCAPVFETEHRLRIRVDVSAVDRATNMRDISVFLEPSRFSADDQPRLVGVIHIGGTLLKANQDVLMNLVETELRKAAA